MPRKKGDIENFEHLWENEQKNKAGFIEENQVIKSNMLWSAFFIFKERYKY